MNTAIKIYLALAAVFLASAITTWLLPISDVLKGVMALPGIGALVGALIQIFRDSSEYERKKYLQLDQQIFHLGANSHMSTVAFDKHVEFCELYMAEVHETIGTLFREGPTKQAMDCAGKLFGLKRNYAAWIPKSISLKLEPFENALHKIGALTHLVGALGRGDAEERSKAIDESYNLFTGVMGLGKLKETAPDQKKEIAIENVKEEVRSILGINELFEIRNFIIKRSSEFVKDNS